MKKPINDPNPRHFTDQEKLELIEAGLMDPKEMGLTCKPSELPVVQGEGPKVLPPAQRGPQLGPWLTFEVTPVPPDIRAHWASQDAKIIPFDKERWKEEHKYEMLIQAILRCGNVQGRFENLVKTTEMTLHEGFCQMLEGAATKLRELIASQEKAKTDESNSESK